jgi:hypothetical protein
MPLSIERPRPERPEIGEIAILFLVVETVPYDERVRDLEPEVVDRNGDLSPAGLIEQGASAERCRTPRP